MALEQLIADQTEALRENTATMKELIAGRDAAMDAIRTGAAAAASGESKPATRRRSKKDDPPAEASTGKDAAASTRRQIDATDDGIKALATGWMGKMTTDAERSAARDQVMPICEHFGTPTIAGPSCTLDDEQRYQAHFYLERIIAGLPVDFSAEYDFDVDPLTQGAAAQKEDVADSFLG